MGLASSLYMQQISCFIYIKNSIDMSQFDLDFNSFQHMPDYPNLGQTLLFIETHRYCPMSSTVSLGRNIPNDLENQEDQELSLELKLQNVNHQTIASASTIKKKKTGCTCKKTKCLKMYCECFASGKMCTAECGCSGCSNCEAHMEEAAKAKQLIQIKASSSNKSNGSKGGCTCKKSQCRKKYCECFNAGVACGGDCKCQDCMNGECDRHEKEKKQGKSSELKCSTELLDQLVSF